MKTLIEDSNYRVLTAANGQEALEIYEQEAGIIVMVISDMVMPVMGGVVLFQTLVNRWPEVKMLFITGHPVNEQDQALLESGNVHWLQKPFSVGVFNEARIKGHKVRVIDQTLRKFVRAPAGLDQS